MTTNAADALERLERLERDMRADATRQRAECRPGTEELMISWANDLAKIRASLADRQGEAVAWPSKASAAPDGDGWIAISRFIEHRMSEDHARVWNGCRDACINAHERANQAPAAGTTEESHVEWCRRMAISEMGQDVRAGSFGIEDSPAPAAVTDAAKVKAWEDAFEHCRKVYGPNKSRSWVLTCLRDQYNAALTAALQIGGE